MKILNHIYVAHIIFIIYLWRGLIFFDLIQNFFRLKLSKVKKETSVQIIQNKGSNYIAIKAIKNNATELNPEAWMKWSANNDKIMYKIN